jgi:hypothetical protein
MVPENGLTAKEIGLKMVDDNKADFPLLENWFA